jgi:hypothetical protein
VSDIDFMVLTKTLLNNPEIEALEKMHKELWAADLKWAKKLEGAYVPPNIIAEHNPDHPPVPTVNEERFYLAPLGSDWVFQRHVLHRPAVRLIGPYLDMIVKPVSQDELLSALHSTLESWWKAFIDQPERLDRPGYQAFAVLSMCRAMNLAETSEINSKINAAHWAIAELSGEWHSLIIEALAWREGQPEGSRTRTIDFIRFTLERFDI